jgi:hypothetical protein
MAMRSTAVQVQDAEGKTGYIVGFSFDEESLEFLLAQRNNRGYMTYVAELLGDALVSSLLGVAQTIKEAN